MPASLCRGCVVEVQVRLGAPQGRIHTAVHHSRDFGNRFLSFPYLALSQLIAEMSQPSCGRRKSPEEFKMPRAPLSCSCGAPWSTRTRCFLYIRFFSSPPTAVQGTDGISSVGLVHSFTAIRASEAAESLSFGYGVGARRCAVIVLPAGVFPIGVHHEVALARAK